MAIRLGTTFRTSTEHARKYTAYMTTYLRLILELYPGTRLTPNQHKALHIGPGLVRFGPAPGWWMFPFERLIGILQKTNHNFKTGQLERTMLTTFTNAANLRGALMDPKCPQVLRDSLPIINKVWKMNTLLLESADEHHEHSPQAAHERPAADIEEMELALQIFLFPKAPPKNIHTVRELRIGKYGFSSERINASQSRVFFQPKGEVGPVPGEIQHVFRLKESKSTYYFSIRRYILPRAPPTTIFQENPDFGAVLVSDELGKLEVVLASSDVHPTTSRRYGKGCLVIKDSSRI